MANKIRGITIDIGADTSKFSEELKKVNSSLSSTQKELNDVNKLLKFNPGNITLTTQKQQLLTKAVNESSDKLKILQQMQDDMKASGIDENTEQYRALQREIVETESKCENYKNQLDETSGSVSQLGKAEEEAGDKAQGMSADQKAASDALQELGETAKGAADKLVGFAKNANDAFSEVDAGADTIIQKTGASGEALDEMTDSMNNIATTIPTTFETAGTAIGEVNTRFGLTGDALEELSGQFIKFASLNGTDVNSSIDNVQKTLSAFGLTADDASALLDTFNKVGQDTGISMDTLASSMVTNATSLQSMGFSASDAAVLLGNLEKSGIDTSVVMTGLSKVQKSAMSDGVSMQEEFQKALSSSDSAIDIFGAKAGPKLYAAFENGTLSVDDFTAGTTSLEDALGSVSDTYEATLDPIDQVTMTQNQLKATMGDLGNSIMESLQPALQGLSDVLSGLNQWWNSLSPSMQGFIVTMGEIIVIVGTAIGIGLTVISTIQKISQTWGLIQTIISANPAGIVITAIAAVVTALVLLYNNCEGFRAVVDTVVHAVIGFFKDLADKIGEKIAAIKEFLGNLGDKITEIKDIIKEKIDGIKDKFEELKSSVMEKLQPVLDKLQAFRDKVSDVWNTVKEKFDNIRDKIQSVVDKIKGAFDFKWELPKIKLPHFSFSGSANPLKWLSEGVPKFNVSWYAKAMDQPYTFTSPTLIGVGEAGAESVVGTQWLKDHMAGNTITNNITVIQQPGEDENALADRVIDRIQMKVRRSTI